MHGNAGHGMMHEDNAGPATCIMLAITAFGLAFRCCKEHGGLSPFSRHRRILRP